MRRRFAACLATALSAVLAGCAVPRAPDVDHHQHAFSPDVAALLATPERPFPPLDADALVRLLDDAGIRRAVLLSVAYLYDTPGRDVDDAAARVRAENDWTAAEAARHPERLVAFCGVHPLAAHALDEIARCARTPGLGRGLKLHLGNGDVRLDDPAHVARLRAVFAAANANGTAIAVHLRASIARERPYGAAQARRFLDDVLPAAPDVPVQIAHFAGSGPGFADPAARDAMRAFADAVARGEPATRNLWFDVASVVDAEQPPALAAEVVALIRAVGPARVLFGSDAAVGANLRPRTAWEAFRRLPLTEDEFETIASNVAPYLR